MTVLSAQLQALFDCADTAGRRRALMLDHVQTLRQGKDGALDVFRLFPAVSAELYPSMGAVSFPVAQHKFQVVELVRFAGGKRAGLRFPRSWYGGSQTPWWDPGNEGCQADDQGFGWSVGGVSREIVQAYNAEGVEIRPTIAYDSNANELVSSEAMSGLVRASYEATYRTVYLFRAGDQILASGNLVAMYRGAQDEASFGGVSPEEPIPVYSVVSEYIADPGGKWEVPPNWPDDNTYPIRTTEPLPDPDGYAQLDRVHESCYLDWNGDMRYERYIVPIEEPYASGSYNYHPEYRLDRGDAPEPNSRWSDAWAQLNWPSIEADVAARYPGIQL